MKKGLLNCFFIFCFLALAVPASFAQQPPEFFYNKKENLHSNPDYVPGPYPAADKNDAKVYYEVKKAELVRSSKDGEGDFFFTIGVGDISFTIMKNETAKVQGYFRDYFGVIKASGDTVESIKLIVDVNSLDTAIGPRNNRIVDVFFQSMKPELGTAVIEFNQFKDGAASGSMLLNGTSREISAQLGIEKKGQSWEVVLKEPLQILISDFGYDSQIYDLMKECNHRSISNAVNINAEISFK